MPSEYDSHKSASLRADKLPYQQGCALMALARTERKSSNQMLSELKDKQGLSSGKDLQHDNTLLKTIKDRGYSGIDDKKEVMTWHEAQVKMRQMVKSKGHGAPKQTRFFAMTYGPNADIDKGDTVGHAVSIGVSKSGGFTVFANNADKDKKGKWRDTKSPGVRPFQSTMSDKHQVMVFQKP